MTTNRILLNLSLSTITVSGLACSDGVGRSLPEAGAGVFAAADGGAPAVDAGRSSDGPASVGLRFDGLYQCNHDSYFGYLRFYPDGIVLQASSTGTPEQVAVWLKPGSTVAAQGSWGLAGSAIQFVTKVPTGGTVEYQGEVGDDQLALQVHSLIADSRYAEVCFYMPVASRK